MNFCNVFSEYHCNISPAKYHRRPYCPYFDINGAHTKTYLPIMVIGLFQHFKSSRYYSTKAFKLARDSSCYEDPGDEGQCFIMTIG